MSSLSCIFFFAQFTFVQEERSILRLECNYDLLILLISLRLPHTRSGRHLNVCEICDYCCNFFSFHFHLKSLLFLFFYSAFQVDQPSLTAIIKNFAVQKFLEAPVVINKFTFIFFRVIKILRLLGWNLKMVSHMVTRDSWVWHREVNFLYHRCSAKAWGGF